MWVQVPSLAPFLFIWRCIEEVITRTTRNIVVLFTTVYSRTPILLGFKVRVCTLQRGCLAVFSQFSRLLLLPFFSFFGYIWRCIEEVITRTTRNRLVGKTARGFESHHLRQCGEMPPFDALQGSLGAHFSLWSEPTVHCYVCLRLIRRFLLTRSQGLPRSRWRRASCSRCQHGCRCSQSWTYPNARATPE